MTASSASNRVMKLLRALTAAALLGASTALTAVMAAPVSASCIGTPTPAKTVFTGTVTGTSHAGRQATVRMTDGRTVTVNGTPDLDAAATSVDRTYENGATYEFHVLNDASPYEDNACTATKLIGAAPAASASRISTAALAIGGAVVLAIVALLIVVLRRRHASRTPAQPA
jgi:fermentation-respiration switch protein FrsA (DUF1100 family)